MRFYTAALLMVIVYLCGVSLARQCPRPPLKNVLKKQYKAAVLNTAAYSTYKQLTMSQLKLKEVSNSTDCPNSDTEKRQAPLLRQRAQISWYQQILAVNTGLAAVKEIYPTTLINYPCCPTASSRCLMTVGSSLYGQIEQRLTTQVVLRQTGRCKAGRPKYQPVIVTDLSVGCHCAVPYVEPENLPEEDRLMEAKTQPSNEVTERD